MEPALSELESALAKTEKDSLWVEGSIWLSLKLDAIGSSNKAIHLLKKMQVDMDKLPLNLVKAKWQNQLGSLLTSNGKLSEGIGHYRIAIRIFEEKKDSVSMAQVLSRIGLIYNNLQDWDNAVTYMKKSEAIALAISDSSALGLVYNNLGSLLMDIGKYAEAEEYYQKAIPIARQRQDHGDMVYLYANRVENFVKMGDLGRAERNLRRADSLLVIDTNHDLQNLVDFAHARVMAAKGNIPETQEYLRRAYEQAVAENNVDLYAYTYLTMAAIEKQIGNYQQALTHTEEYYKIMDTLRSAENMRSLEEMNMEFEAEKERSEKALVLADQKSLETKQRYLLVIAIATIAFLALVSIISLRANRRNRQFNKVLKERQSTIEKQFQELDKTHNELQESHAEQDALMAIVAHDLKAPLNKIFSLLRMIEAFKDNPDQQNAMVAKAYEIIAGGQTLIDELVLVSSLDKTQKAVELEETNLNDVLQACYSSFLARAADKGIELKLEIPGQAVHFHTHRDYLNRILDNLVSNALKFSPRETTVKISMAANADSCAVSIQDQGPGIAQAEQGQLFRKFAKLSNRPTGGESSTGLGLSIVKTLVEKLKGEITFTSEVGRGTEFRIRFSRKP